MTPNASHRALVVDDEPLIRWWLSEALGARGCAVTEASDGRAALEAIAGDPTAFEVVLLDFLLPDSTDFRLLQRLRSLAPTARIILMTACVATELRRQALALGASSVLAKPFQIDDVTALVPWAETPAA